MYLRRLEMKGFKSFPDKLEIDFEQGITCIVGPNGSGKSNITDAVRWVLGEQKIKNLRGDNMQDVIFNGTKQRKPLGYAEVSLVFDNTDTILPIDFLEVRVTRKLYRSGESEYAINGETCRLKDVRELFYDTGIGVEGYSIIGQGRIDALLSSNADERRLIFEEAAGIVKFKNKKNEALKKLEKTNDNLTRVSDIVNELKVRIEPLREQSEKAKIFLELSEKLKRLEINYFLDEIEEIEEELKQIQIQMQSLGIKLTDGESQLSALVQQQKDESEALHEALTKQKNLRDEQLELLSVQRDHESNAARIEERRRNIEDQGSRLRMDLNLYQGELKAKDEKLAGIDHKLGQFHDMEQDQKTALYALERNVEQEREALRVCREKQENANRSTMEKQNLLERYKGEDKRYETIIGTLGTRQAAIDKERDGLKGQLETLGQKLDAHRLRMTELTTVQQSSVNQFNEETAKAQGYKAHIDALQGELKQLEATHMEKNARAKVLQELEDSYEGYQYSVKKLFENRSALKGVKLHGVVGDLFKVEQKYEVAVEVALGRAIQNVVVDTETEANAAIDFLKARHFGRATFMPLQYFEAGKERRQEGSADRCLQFEPKYQALFENLLGKTLFVEDMAEALKVFNSHQKKIRVITLEGDVLSPSGTITGGSYQQKQSGLLSRKRELETLTEELQGLGKSILEVKDKLAAGQQQLTEKEKELKRISEALDTFKVELLTLKNRVDAEHKESEYYGVQLKSLDDESALILKDLTEAQAEMERIRTQIAHQEADGAKLTAEQANLGETIIQQSAKLLNLEQELTDRRIELAKEEEKVSGYRADKNRLESEKAKLQESIQECHQHMSNLDAEKSATQAQYAELEEKLKDLGDQLVLQEQAIEQVQKLSEALEKQRAEAVTKQEKLRQAVAALEQQRNQTEVQKARQESKREALIDALWTKYEMSYLQALDMREKIKKSEYSTTMRKLKGDIRDLGEVNTLAIKEFEEVNERHAFLEAQQQDLIQAEKALLSILRDMEQKMKAQFKDKLIEIQENFSAVFSELFGGGHSELVLSNPDNPLEGDIDIVVQPPGKKLQNLNLMSGGEKALTAIALLFAILKTKPSPFCILDEIEAALDDANVDRFADFMKVFAHRSQFVIITHRKGTMEIADSLFGVTMEEFGVSKLLALKLEDYESGGTDVQELV